MQFRKYVSEDSIFLDRDFKTVREVHEFLSDEFSKDLGMAREKVLGLLEEREQLSSTWIGHSTLLPHNHSPEVKGISMIFIRCGAPLVLEDGNRVKYIFSILTSGSNQDLYLGILQGIGKVIGKRSGELDNCQTPAEVLDILSDSSSTMGAPLTAADLARYWPRAKDTDTLSVAVDQMKRHNIYFLPVYSAKDGKICGVLDLLDLLKAGFPEYVFRLNNLSMLKDFQPVDYFWKNEANLKIGTYLRDYRPYMIRESITYPEIFFMMVKGNRRHLLVVDESGEMIGVINPNEIINKMLRP